MCFWSGVCTSTARLDGKVVIITGGNAGIGKETALNLSARGARVILACRDLEKAKDVANEIRQKTQEEVIIQKLDLTSFTSIHNCAQEIKKKEKKIHILINNAGILTSNSGKTEDGIDELFAANYLGHFLLTCLLLPVLIESAPARIINLSSVMHWFGGIDFDNLDSSKLFSQSRKYSRSKIALILFTRELSWRLKGTGVTTYAVDPGVVYTRMTQRYETSDYFILSWLNHLTGRYLLKTPEQGAQTTICCAVDEEIGNQSGLFYKDCKEAYSSPASWNMKTASKLWHESLKLVQLNVDPLPDETSSREC